MVREVVVVFDGGEGGGFAVESEVVDGNGGGEEALDGWENKSINLSPPPPKKGHRLKLKHTFQHPQSGAENRDQGHMRRNDFGGVCVTQWGLMLNVSNKKLISL